MSLSKHDKFWANKLLVPSIEGVHLSNKKYWDRRKFDDEDTVGFLYSSNSILILDLKCDIEERISKNIKNINLGDDLYSIIEMFNLKGFEVDCDDLDFFRYSQVKYKPRSNFSVQKLHTINNDISYFVNTQPKKDVHASGIDDEFDAYYVAYFNGEIVALSGVFKSNNSYYTSLSIITDSSKRKLGFARSLLSYICEDIENRGGELCFRVNKDNSSSISLCKSCGFQEVSRVQTLSIKS